MHAQVWYSKISTLLKIVCTRNVRKTGEGVKPPIRSSTQCFHGWWRSMMEGVWNWGLGLIWVQKSLGRNLAVIQAMQFLYYIQRQGQVMIIVQFMVIWILVRQHCDILNQCKWCPDKFQGYDFGMIHNLLVMICIQ